MGKTKKKDAVDFDEMFGFNKKKEEKHIFSKIKNVEKIKAEIERMNSSSKKEEFFLDTGVKNNKDKALKLPDESKNINMARVSKIQEIKKNKIVDKKNYDTSVKKTKSSKNNPYDTGAKKEDNFMTPVPKKGGEINKNDTGDIIYDTSVKKTSPRSSIYGTGAEKKVGFSTRVTKNIRLIYDTGVKNGFSFKKEHREEVENEYNLKEREINFLEVLITTYHRFGELFTIKNLMKMSGYSRRAVLRKIKKLENLGLLIIYREIGKNNQYSLKLLEEYIGTEHATKKKNISVYKNNKKSTSKDNNMSRSEKWQARAVITNLLNYEKARRIGINKQTFNKIVIIVKENKNKNEEILAFMIGIIKGNKNPDKLAGYIYAVYQDARLDTITQGNREKAKAIIKYTKNLNGLGSEEIKQILEDPSKSELDKIAKTIGAKMSQTREGLVKGIVAVMQEKDRMLKELDE